MAKNYLVDEKDDAKEVIALIRKAGQKAIAIPGDLRSESFCQQMVKTAVEVLGGLDILVNNTGRQQTYSSYLNCLAKNFMRR